MTQNQQMDILSDEQISLNAQFHLKIVLLLNKLVIFSKVLDFEDISNHFPKKNTHNSKFVFFGRLIFFISYVKKRSLVFCKKIRFICGQ